MWVMFCGLSSLSREAVKESDSVRKYCLTHKFVFLGGGAGCENTADQDELLEVSNPPLHLTLYLE